MTEADNKTTTGKPAEETDEPREAGKGVPPQPEMVRDETGATTETAAGDETGATTETAGQAGESGAVQAEAEVEPPEPDAEQAAAAEIAALRDRLLRLQADFDNYRKRQARERSEWIAQANSGLLEDILPALDQTDLALAAAQKDASEASKPFLDGFALVRRTLLSSLAKHGLKPVDGTVGKPLDTATSEAVTVMRTGQAKPGCVVYETRKGYTLNGKMLRAAQVVVEEEPEQTPGRPAPKPEAGETSAAGAEPPSSQAGEDQGNG